MKKRSVPIYALLAIVASLFLLSNQAIAQEPSACDGICSYPKIIAYADCADEAFMLQDMCDEDYDNCPDAIWTCMSEHSQCTSSVTQNLVNCKKKADDNYDACMAGCEKAGPAHSGSAP